MLRLAQPRLVDPISASLRVARAVHKHWRSRVRSASRRLHYPGLLLLSQVAVHRSDVQSDKDLSHWTWRTDFSAEQR